MRKKMLLSVALLTAGIVLLTQATSEAQRRQRGPGGRGGRGGFGRFGGASSAFRYLATNKYAQEVLQLTSKQKETVMSVSIQLEGTRALSREDIQQKLGLSETQKTKIEEARRSAFQGLFGGGRRRRGNDNQKRPSREDIQKRFQEAREKAEKAVMEVLTSAQKSKFEQMKGKKVDIEKLNAQPQRRPRQRPDV